MLYMPASEVSLHNVFSIFICISICSKTQLQMQRTTQLIVDNLSPAIIIIGQQSRWNQYLYLSPGTLCAVFAARKLRLLISLLLQASRVGGKSISQFAFRILHLASRDCECVSLGESSPQLHFRICLMAFRFNYNNSNSNSNSNSNTSGNATGNFQKMLSFCKK